MTEAEAYLYERMVDNSLSMLDLPDGKFLWAAKEEVNGEWVIVVRKGEDE